MSPSPSSSAPRRSDASAGPREQASTKIVATIGPGSEGLIPQLIERGMAVARLNFSHGEPEEHRRRADVIRKASRQMQIPVAILADIQGPKLRMGRFKSGPRELEVDDEFEVLPGDGEAEDNQVYFNFEGFLRTVEPGHRVVLADGAVAAVIEEAGPRSFRARVTRGGEISDRKGVNLPDSAIELELPTPKDEADITLARQIGVEMLGVSFVGTATDVETIRELAPEPMIVSKIERALALVNLDEILTASDGIMIARGDLGVEVELEQLPMLQKSLTASSLGAGKFVITATEMLESMISSSRPTRAEVADVANAVLDGSDAVMLSAETAVGKYPLEAVAVMNRIALAVEGSEQYAELPRVAFRSSEPTFSNAIAKAAVEAAEALGLKKIIAFTETGNTVRLLSRYRPGAEIIALTPNERTMNSMAVLAHVRPMLYRRQTNLEEMMQYASLHLLDQGLVRGGEQVLFVAGVPPGVARTTNLMKLHRIGEQLRFS